MQSETLQSEKLSDERVGKRIGDNFYVHVSASSTLSPDQQSIIAQASKLSSLILTDHFNVVKLTQQNDDLSLIDYPIFLYDPFPTLARKLANFPYACYRLQESTRAEGNGLRAVSRAVEGGDTNKHITSKRRRLAPH